MRIDRKKIGLGIVIGAVFLCFYHLMFVKSAFSPISQSYGVAPDFVLSDIDGHKICLHEHIEEHPVLLYFWATWCPACRAARPALIKQYDRMRNCKLEVLAINVGVGDFFKRVRSYQEHHPMPFRVLYDHGSKVTQVYRVEGIPLFVIIGSSGEVLYRGHRLPEDPLQYLGRYCGAE